jgi:hypothetical protein
VRDYNGDRTISLDDIDLSAAQRRRAEEVLVVRRGLAGESVVDAEEWEEWVDWILGNGAAG